MLKIVRDSVLKVSRALGYDIVPLRDVKDRDFALHLRQLFDRLAIDCVFDVGANVGQYRDFLRERVFYKGLIVSFEPVARNIETLRARAKSDRNWHIEGYALGAAEATKPLNVMASDQFSSFLEPDHRLLGSFGGHNVADHTETVRLRTLDAVLPDLRQRLGFKQLYLKLDTQGFDIEVLRGAERSLPDIHALQTEASVINIYKGMPGYRQTLDHLGELGFDITGLYPVSRDPQLRLIEFDCVMINRRLAAPRG